MDWQKKTGHRRGVDRIRAKILEKSEKKPQKTKNFYMIKQKTIQSGQEMTHEN